MTTTIYNENMKKVLVFSILSLLLLSCSNNEKFFNNEVKNFYEKFIKYNDSYIKENSLIDYKVTSTFYNYEIQDMIQKEVFNSAFIGKINHVSNNKTFSMYSSDFTFNASYDKYEVYNYEIISQLSHSESKLKQTKSGLEVYSLKEEFNDAEDKQTNTEKIDSELSCYSFDKIGYECYGPKFENKIEKKRLIGNKNDKIDDYFLPNNKFFDSISLFLFDVEVTDEKILSTDRLAFWISKEIDLSVNALYQEEIVLENNKFLSFKTYSLFSLMKSGKRLRCYELVKELKVGKKDDISEKIDIQKAHLIQNCLSYNADFWAHKSFWEKI